jgi:hypothetical protein
VFRKFLMASTQSWVSRLVTFSDGALRDWSSVPSPRECEVAQLVVMHGHPRIRAGFTCPRCNGPKDKELLLCWPCHNAETQGTGHYSRQTEQKLDSYERVLALIDKEFVLSAAMNLRMDLFARGVAAKEPLESDRMYSISRRIV